MGTFERYAEHHRALVFTLLAAVQAAHGAPPGAASDAAKVARIQAALPRARRYASGQSVESMCMDVAIAAQSAAGGDSDAVGIAAALVAHLREPGRRGSATS